MYKRIEQAEFEAHVEGAFQASVAEGETADLVLKKVAEGHPATGEYECFSLLFHSQKTVFLPQKTYSVHHEALGDFSLFLVPVGETDTAYQYEAVFHRTRVAT